MDKYTMIGTIGEGAYGVVYKGKDEMMNDFVAIKKFKFQDDDELSKRELQACSMLNHPNIVTFRDSFRFDGKLHLVFDFAQNNMFMLLERNREGLETSRAIRLVYQLCKAVHCCHSNNIIHRDIKPENILLDRNENVKLCDFGVARIIQYEGGPLTDYVATRWYRPPEQELRCKHYSYTSDIWSIGCILAELITGKPLFPGESQLDQISLIQDLLGPLPKHLEDKFSPGMSKKQPSSCIQEKFKRFPTLVQSFLQETLDVNPKSRLDSNECINHALFNSLRETDEKQDRERRQKQIESLNNECAGDIEEDIQCMSHSSKGKVTRQHLIAGGGASTEDEMCEDIQEIIEEVVEHLPHGNNGLSPGKYKKLNELVGSKRSEDRRLSVDDGEYEDDFEELGESTMLY